MESKWNSRGLLFVGPCLNFMGPMSNLDGQIGLSILPVVSPRSELKQTGQGQVAGVLFEASDDNRCGKARIESCSCIAGQVTSSEDLRGGDRATIIAIAAAGLTH